MSDVTITDWAWVAVTVVQSLVGAIPASLRKVELIDRSEDWLLRATFSSGSQEDAEEFSEVIDDIYVYMCDLAGIVADHVRRRAFVFEAIYTDAKLGFDQSLCERIIFQRKEN